MTLEWLRTKVSQRCFGSGVRTGLWSRRYLPTVRGETRMVSFSFNSLAIRSSPQVGFSAAISRISLRRSLGIPGLPGSRDFPAPEETESHAVPTDEGIGLDVHQGVTPREHVAQNHHDQPSGIIGQVWLHLALLEQRELFTQEEGLGCERAARPRNEDEEMDE